MCLRQSLSAPSLCVGCGLGMGGGGGGAIFLLVNVAYIFEVQSFGEKNSWAFFYLTFYLRMLVNVILGNYIILLGFGLANATLRCALTRLFRLNIKQKCSATCPTSYLPSCVQAVFPIVSRPQTVLQTWNVCSHTLLRPVCRKSPACAHTISTRPKNYGIRGFFV